MKRRRIVMVLPVFAAGLLVGVLPPFPGHSAVSKVTNLLTAELSPEFTPDREVLVDLVEIPPNQKLDWHWHPGEEFHSSSSAIRQRPGIRGRRSSSSESTRRGSPGVIWTTGTATKV